ncbi:hypothetical protein [Metallibacterium sp.]|uniref:hypothetical protein n=1 Tax=Metallibacterium sp. TaxID=2940281 RepID=UPI00260A6E70|nr:hypothetical protein [Metallibacterium sp.]
MNLVKTLALYAALIAAAVGTQHVLVQMTRDSDAPILAIAKANAAQPFGAQIPASQLAAIQATNATTIAADRQALAQAEQGATP